MKLLLRLALFLGALLAQSLAHGLALPGGITVEPPSSLDLTYQVVSDYDPVEKVLAGWAGDKLQYFVSVEKLPPGWTDHAKYFQGLVRDFRAAGRSVETAGSGSYATASTLSGRYLLIRSRPSSQAAPTSQTVHFITDGKVTFVAIATLTEKDAEARMVEETQLLFRSASLSGPGAGEPSSVKAETPYVGTWKWLGTAPDGRSAASTITLKADLSFSLDLVISAAVAFRGVGVWSVSQQKVYWRYLRSEPPLPADRLEDEDDVVAFDRARLVLRSRSTGREREFLRQ